MAESLQTTTDAFFTNDYSVEVTLTGDGIDPEDISSILGKKPSKVGRKGDPRHPDRPDVHEESFWSHEINSRDDVNQCRDHHISCLIDDIAPHIGRLKDAGMERIYFYYTISSSIGMLNMKLNPETMRRLSDIDADLYISCFDCFDPNHDFWKAGEGIETA